MTCAPALPHTDLFLYSCGESVPCFLFRHCSCVVSLQLKKQERVVASYAGQCNHGDRVQPF